MDKEKLDKELSDILDHSGIIKYDVNEITKLILDNFVGKEEFNERVSFINDIMWALDPDLKWKTPCEYKKEIIAKIKLLKEIEKNHIMDGNIIDHSGKPNIKEREHILSKDCWCNPTVEDYSHDSKPRECNYVGVVRPTWTCSFCGLTNYVGEDCKCNKKHATTKPTPKLPSKIEPDGVTHILGGLTCIEEKINEIIDYLAERG